MKGKFGAVIMTQDPACEDRCREVSVKWKKMDKEKLGKRNMLSVHLASQVLVKYRIDDIRYKMLSKISGCMYMDAGAVHELASMQIDAVKIFCGLLINHTPALSSHFIIPFPKPHPSALKMQRMKAMVRKFMRHDEKFMDEMLLNRPAFEFAYSASSDLELLKMKKDLHQSAIRRLEYEISQKEMHMEMQED